ncbi:MAG: hypothetical protein JEZ03_03490 [Bacteroidales bacterium]|nr:hypothetical protein [Bacteroidales bacterium]
MKKMRFLAFMLIASAVSFTACNKDEEDPNLDKTPTITLKGGGNYISANNTVTFGEVFAVGITANANADTDKKLVSFNISAVKNNTPEVIFDSTFSSDTFDFDFTLKIDEPTKADLLNVNWIFEVVDKDGEKKSVSLTSTVESNLVKRQEIEFGSWNDAIGSFYSVDMDSVYTKTPASENQAKIDLVFFKGSSNGDTWAAPNDADLNTISDLGVANWTIKNATLLEKTALTAVQFDAINYYNEIPDMTVAAETKVNNLETGNVFLFKTANDVIGLAKVVDLYTRGDKAKLEIIIKK